MVYNPEKYESLQDVKLIQAIHIKGDPDFKRAFDELGKDDMEIQSLIDSWKIYIINIVWKNITSELSGYEELEKYLLKNKLITEKEGFLAKIIYSFKRTKFKITNTVNPDGSVTQGMELGTDEVENNNQFDNNIIDYNYIFAAIDDILIKNNKRIWVMMDRLDDAFPVKWSDINFETGHIHVQRSLARTKENGLFFKSVKTESSDRIVVVSDYVINLLNEHQQRQKKLKNKLEKSFIENDLVNCTCEGKPIEPRNLLRQFQSLIKEADLPKITFHDLRHLHATTLMALGENPKVVADRLGHSRVQVTLDIYSHVSTELQRLTANKFEEDFFKDNVQ